MTSSTHVTIQLVFLFITHGAAMSSKGILEVQHGESPSGASQLKAAVCRPVERRMMHIKSKIAVNGLGVV